MAVRENQLTELTDISTQDYARIVTSGGSSARTKIAYIANTLLSIYKTSMAGKSQTVVEAIDNLAKPEYSGQGYGACLTSASTGEKTASLSGYRKVTGGIVTIRFVYDVPANATLNINSTGASPIYYMNNHITAGVIKGGDICTFIYDGDYNLISKDSPIIVETGTTASWKYIKYSDGRVDLSTTLSLAAAEGSQWVSGQPFYYQDTNISLPSGMLTETPSDIVATSGNTQWWIFGVWASNSNTLRARLVKIVSSAQAALVRVRVIGKWM